MYISIWNLLWIAPVSLVAGSIVMAVIAVNNR